MCRTLLRHATASSTGCRQAPLQVRRLAHFNLDAQDWQASSRFYTDLLGMQVSDWIKGRGDVVKRRVVGVGVNLETVPWHMP